MASEEPLLPQQLQEEGEGVWPLGTGQEGAGGGGAGEQEVEGVHLEGRGAKEGKGDFK